MLSKSVFSVKDIVIHSFFNSLELNHAFTILISAADSSAKLDLSIEGMRSQQYSVGIFAFMLLGVFVFAAIVYAVVFGKAAPKTMRTGEKVLIGAIILGMIFGVGFGATQMLSGYLF